MEIDPVIFEFHARVSRYEADVKRTTQTIDQQLGRQEARVKRLERELASSSVAISSTFRTLAGTLATVFTGRELVGLIDSFTRFQNQLKVAGLEGEALAEVQGRLADAGARYGVSIESLAELYGNSAQIGKELGATQAELLTLTDATSQALLITGKSSQQAAGAILGLTQALGSGNVKVEEFNQINEGGLRPLLQAAANSERFGGSVTKLRAAIADGKVTSQEFYRAILDNSAALEEQASKAVIPLANALQSLRDQLGIYFGEASQGAGATEALAAAIQGLANNLDVIIPALAVVATALGVRTVAGAVAASNAFFALSAAMAGAATATEGLAFALKGLQGVAVVALILGLTVALEQARQASLNAGRASAEYAKQQQQLTKLQGAAKEATQALAVATGEARKQALANAQALREEAKQALANARAKAIAARETARLAGIAAQKEVRTARAVGGPLTSDPFGGTGIAIAGPAQQAETRAQINLRAARKAVSQAEGVVEDLGEAIKSLAPVNVSPVRSSQGNPKSSPNAPDPSGPSGPSAAEIGARQAGEIARLQQEELRARIQLAADTEERARLERDLLQLEYDDRAASIRADKELSAEQKKAQLAILQKLYGVESALDEQATIVVGANQSLYAQQIAREEARQMEREAQELADERYQAETNALRLQLDLADTQKERRDLALQILEAEDAYLRSKLEAVLASEIATDAERKRAQIALDALNASAGDRKGAVLEQYQSALGRYAKSAKDADSRIAEAAAQRIAEINDTIADAMTDALGIKDPFLSELIKIFLDKNIFGPLADALGSQGSGGGGLGAVFSTIGALFGGGSGGAGSTGGGIHAGVFGRASGGYVAPGSLYRVNEGSSPGRVEAFRPNVGGQIIPLGQMNALQGATGAAGGTVKLVIEEAPGFAARVRAEATDVSIEVTRQAAPALVDASASEALRRAGRPSL